MSVFQELTAKGAYFLSKLLIGTTLRNASTSEKTDLGATLRSFVRNILEMNVSMGNDKHHVPCRLIGLGVTKQVANARRRKLRKEAEKKGRALSKKQLASSSELIGNRKIFEIFISRKNKEWVNKGVFLELVIWEDFLDALSQIRMQDEYNKAIRQSDIFVMLFFTKVGKYPEEEFGTAFGQFKDTNKPCIFTCFKDAGITTGSANKQDLMSLWAFQEKLGKLGHFYIVYKNLDELKLKFNQQLDKLADAGFTKKGNIKQYATDQVSPDLVFLRNAYLNRIFETSRQLSLAGVDPKAASSEKEARLSLDAVCTALLTLTPEAHEKMLQGESPKKKIQRQAALVQLNRNPRMVLLSDPGSGKSTFVNFVTLCLSGELLKQKELNVSLFTKPLPVEGEEETKPQAWDHGALLPVRVILRDFAVQGLPAANGKTTATHLWEFIKSDLRFATLEKYAIPMQEELLEKGAEFL